MSHSILPALPETSASGGGVMVIMLALNLIILAFFILLNALSQPAEDRQAAAIYGLQEGFDARSNAGRIGDDHTTQVGPAWVAPMEAQVSGLVRQAWPGAMVTMDAEMGVIEVRLALPDAWGEGAFDSAFVAMVENLTAVLKDAPEAGLMARVESVERGEGESAAPLFAAAAEQLPGVPLGWTPVRATAEYPQGAMVLVISRAASIPEDAKLKADRLLRGAGAAVERKAE
jgi:hypothetical protein